MTRPVKHLCTNDGCGEEMFVHVGLLFCPTCDMVIKPPDPK